MFCSKLKGSRKDQLLLVDATEFEIERATHLLVDLGVVESVLVISKHIQTSSVDGWENTGRSFEEETAKSEIRGKSAASRMSRKEKGRLTER